MDDIIGIAIPILLFVIPVSISVLDARRKKAAGQKQVVSRPLEFPEEQKAEPESTAAAHRGAQSHFESARLGAGAEGERALKRRTAAVEDQAGEHKLSVDPRKLILYSEIMKPKFDE